MRPTSTGQDHRLCDAMEENCVPMQQEEHEAISDARITVRRSEVYERTKSSGTHHRTRLTSLSQKHEPCDAIEERSEAAGCRRRRWAACVLL